MHHPEATKHALALSNLAVTREHDVVVVDVEDEPGVLADLARRVARAGVDLDFVYVATNNRVVFSSKDTAALEAALGSPPGCSHLKSALIAATVASARARAASAKSSPDGA